MLRRSVATAYKATPLAFASSGGFAPTRKLDYKYQDFEMSKMANQPFHYPREAPNTSYFPQYMSGFWTWIGWGREEVWIDRDARRYETSWQIMRKLIMIFYPVYYIFPWCFPLYLYKELWGEYGEKPFLWIKHPHDCHFLEFGGEPLDAEWVRHIHSKENL